MSYLELFLSFMLGVVASRILDSFRINRSLVVMIREAERSCLIMLATAAESVAYIQSIKFSTMEQLGLEENTVKLTKNIDEQNFNQWKQAAINNLHSAYPDNFKKMPKYYSWKQAMNFLDGVYRQNRLDKKDK
jgi:hypothetical protein|tara:strand:+ start:479 stop:877 length:399 start_codon:yes stop_codon:yes gene_type:complete